MSPSRTERRSLLQRLGTLLFDDLWRKLAALGLAIGLWSYLDAQLSDESERTLALRFAPTAEVSSRLDNTRLTIGLDFANYGVVSVTDDAGTPVDSVKITVYGARRLVGLLQTATGFRAQPEVVEDGGELVARLDAKDVVIEEPRIADLRLELDPPVVRIGLARMVSERIPLEPSRINRTPLPGAASSFFERILWSRTSFEEPTAVLFGPERQVRDLAQNAAEIFRLPAETAPPAPDASSFRVTLEPVFAPAKAGWAGLRVEPQPTAEFMLRVDEIEFTLTDVPVLLHTPPELAGYFALRHATEELRIAATGRLQARLLTLDETRRREWVAENCLIVAPIPPDATGPDVISRPHVIVGPDYREGRDYKITLPLTIQYVDQPRKKDEEQR